MVSTSIPNTLPSTIGSCMLSHSAFVVQYGLLHSKVGDMQNSILMRVELSSFDKPASTQHLACGNLCMWNTNHYASCAELFCACVQVMAVNNRLMPISSG